MESGGEVCFDRFHVPIEVRQTALEYAIDFGCLHLPIEMDDPIAEPGHGPKIGREFVGQNPTLSQQIERFDITRKNAEGNGGTDVRGNVDTCLEAS